MWPLGFAFASQALNVWPLGFALARRCLKDHEDTDVILACRSLERANSAAQSLAAECAAWRGRVSVVELDASSDASVDAAASRIAERLQGGTKLYAVVNNAGSATGSVRDLVELNARGPRRVSNAFVPLLEPQGGRVVNISSGAATMCVRKCSAERRALLTDLNVSWAQLEALLEECEALSVEEFEARGIGTTLGAYGMTKAALNAHTAILAREHPNLKVNACTPGMINTDLLKDAAPYYVPNFLVPLAARFLVGALPPDAGTLAPLFLLFGEPEGNGRYYGSDGLRSPLDIHRAPGTPPYEGP